MVTHGFLTAVYFVWILGCLYERYLMDKANVCFICSLLSALFFVYLSFRGNYMTWDRTNPSNNQQCFSRVFLYTCPVTNVICCPLLCFLSSPHLVWQKNRNLGFQVGCWVKKLFRNRHGLTGGNPWFRVAISREHLLAWSFLENRPHTSWCAPLSPCFFYY